MKQNLISLVAFMLLCMLDVHGIPLRYTSFTNIRSTVSMLKVKGIVQSNDGMIWFATDDGLNAWDGYNLHSYNYVDSVGVGALKCALVKGDTIYMGYERGMVGFDLEKYEYIINKVYAGEHVRCMANVGSQLWVGTDNGVWIDGRPTQWGLGRIYGLMCIDDAVYCAFESGIAKYSLKSKRMEYRRQVMPFAMTLCRRGSHENSIWVGTPMALCTMNVDDGEILNELSLPVIKCMAADDDGNLLVGTDGGLFVVAPDMQTWHLSHSASNTAESLADNVVWSIFADKDGNMWIGTDNGVSCSPRQQWVKNISLPVLTGSDDGNLIYCIHKTHDGVLWAGGTNGILCVENVGTALQTCRWYRMNDPQWPIRHNRIRCITEDSNHRLWVGIDGAVMLYDPASQQLKAKRIDGDRYNWVYEIVDQGNDVMMIRTFQNTYMVSTKEAVAGSNTLSVIRTLNTTTPIVPASRIKIDGSEWTIDSDGSLMISSNNDSVSLNIWAADRYISMCYDSIAGELWLGGSDKVTVIAPDGLINNQLNNRPVITHVEVMGKGLIDHSVLMEHKISLPETQNSLLIYLSDFNYSDDKLMHFAFRIENMQDEWVEMKPGTNTLLLSALRPGKYKLEIRDCKHDVVGASEVIDDSLVIEILPPWYRSKMAYAFYFLMLIILIVMILLYIKGRKKLKEEREMKAQILQNARKKEAELISDKNALEQKLRLSMLAASEQGDELSTDDRLLLSLTKIIEDNMDNPDMSVDLLSKESGISSKQIYRKVKAMTGMTAVAFIRNLRLQKAAMLLSAGGHFSTKEVMYIVGFSNASYFTRCFASEYGMTPSEYMAKYKENGKSDEQKD